MESEWISVEERLPEELTSVFILYKARTDTGGCSINGLFDRDTYYATTAFFYEGEFTSHYLDTDEYPITHWFPMPKIPEYLTAPRWHDKEN